jgi:glycine betaine/proline transport system substrate-binding protein
MGLSNLYAGRSALNCQPRPLQDLMHTLTLVIMSALISLIIGVPLGIAMAKSDRTQAIVQPILDFMQTMPGFVYLIPAVAFFGIGVVPGVFASIILPCHQWFG